MLNAIPANHTPTAISDTMGMRFHIAILETKKDTMGASMIVSLGVGGDLHAENNHERCKCPRGITQCLGRSKSHTIRRARAFGAVPLQNRLSLTATKRLDAHNNILPAPALQGLT